MLAKELIEMMFKADGGVEYSVPDKITPELLEGGTFLKKATEICNRNRTQALHRMSEFFGIRNKLESVRDNVRKSITETEHTIEKIDVFGGGMREAGQRIANTFRSFADKKTVDYSNKGKKFSKTEFAQKPFVVQKRLYESMEKYLDAAIDKLESLAMDTRQEKPEILGMVAEQQCKYGADTFEAYQKAANGLDALSLYNTENLFSSIAGNISSAKTFAQDFPMLFP